MHRKYISSVVPSNRYKNRYSMKLWHASITAWHCLTFKCQKVDNISYFCKILRNISSKLYHTDNWKTTRQCRSWWNCSLWATSSILFANKLFSFFGALVLKQTHENVDCLALDFFTLGRSCWNCNSCNTMNHTAPVQTAQTPWALLFKTLLAYWAR